MTFNKKSLILTLLNKYQKLMRNFSLYGLMLLACGIMGVIISLVVYYSWWYTLLLSLAIPTWWVSYSLFKVLLPEDSKNKTCFCLFLYLIVLILAILFGTVYIGTNGFWKLTLAMSLLTSTASTIALILSIINKKKPNLWKERSYIKNRYEISCTDFSIRFI